MLLLLSACGLVHRVLAQEASSSTHVESCGVAIAPVPDRT